MQTLLEMLYMYMYVTIPAIFLLLTSDSTFEVGVLSPGSTNFLKELDVISR